MGVAVGMVVEEEGEGEGGVIDDEEDKKGKVWSNGVGEKLEKVVEGSGE